MSLISRFAEKIGGDEYLFRKLAGRVSKEEFLDSLRLRFWTELPRNFDVDEEVKRARKRIENSKFSKLFAVVGVTDEDLKGVLTKVKNEKLQH